MQKAQEEVELLGAALEGAGHLVGHQGIGEGHQHQDDHGPAGQSTQGLDDQQQGQSRRGDIEVILLAAAQIPDAHQPFIANGGLGTQCNGQGGQEYIVEGRTAGAVLADDGAAGRLEQEGRAQAQAQHRQCRLLTPHGIAEVGADVEGISHAEHRNGGQQSLGQPQPGTAQAPAGRHNGGVLDFLFFHLWGLRLDQCLLGSF